MSFSHSAWNQLKGITADELIAALVKDHWECDMNGGSMRIYKKGTNRVSVHYHSKKTYGAKMLKDLLDDIGWSEEDMKRIKLIK